MTESPLAPLPLEGLVAVVRTIQRGSHRGAGVAGLLFGAAVVRRLVRPGA